MFGSNFPVDSLYSDDQALIDAYRALVPAQDHAAVFGTNAARFYKLNPDAPL